MDRNPAAVTRPCADRCVQWRKSSGAWYCRLCGKEATDSHVHSDSHAKYVQQYGDGYLYYGTDGDFSIQQPLHQQQEVGVAGLPPGPATGAASHPPRPALGGLGLASVAASSAAGTATGAAAALAARRQPAPPGPPAMSAGAPQSAPAGPSPPLAASSVTPEPVADLRVLLTAVLDRLQHVQRTLDAIRLTLVSSNSSPPVLVLRGAAPGGTASGDLDTNEV